MSSARFRSFLVIVSLTGLFALHVALFKGFIVDDAFITFRYAQQAARGYGWVYNIGERVEGYSNFLWLVLLTFFAHMGVELTVVAKGLGLLCSFLTLYVTWRAAQEVEGPPLAPWFLVVSGPFAAWAVGGLETPLFTLLLLSSGYLFVQEELHGHGYFSSLLFGLLALTRPEGLIFAGVAGGFRVWRLFMLRSHPTRHDFLRLLLFGLVVIPYHVWRLTYYGQILPNTVYAKSMGLHPRAFLEGIFYLYQSLRSCGGFFFVGLPVLLALSAPRVALSVLYWSSNVAVYALLLTIGGGDWMPMQRFAVHLLPPLFLVVQAGFGRLRDLWPLRRHAILLTVLVLGQMGYMLGLSVEKRFVAGTGAGPIIRNDPPLVTYLRQHLHPGDVIALTDAGFIAYRLPSDVHVVDMVGLTDAHIAHQPVELPGGLWGRGDAFGKWDVDYVLAQRPRFVQVNIIGETDDGQWVTNFTGTTLLINDPRFRAQYVQVTAPGVSGLFVLKEEQD